MTMHLCGPSLTTSGHKKTKRKFRSAEEAKRHRELESSWDSLKKKWGVSDDNIKTKKSSYTTKVYSPKRPVTRSTNADIPSLNSFPTGPVSSKETQKYTGENLIGIAVQHKSCLQPVFTDDEAKDSASMRR